MMRNNSEGRVTCSATVRVARLTVFDISQRISSTRTVDRAMFVEKVALATERAVMRSFLRAVVCSRHANPGSCASWWLLYCACPESSGNSLCDTATATKKNVATNGKAEMAMAEGLRFFTQSGLQASQSSWSGSMEYKRTWTSCR